MVVTDTIFVCEFVHSDLGVDICFEKEEDDRIMERWFRSICETLVLRSKVKSHARGVSFFIIFCADKKRTQLLRALLYFYTFIIGFFWFAELGFKIEQKMHTKVLLGSYRNCSAWGDGKQKVR